MFKRYYKTVGRCRRNMPVRLTSKRFAKSLDTTDQSEYTPATLNTTNATFCSTISLTEILEAIAHSDEFGDPAVGRSLLRLAAAEQGISQIRLHHLSRVWKGVA